MKKKIQKKVRRVTVGIIDLINTILASTIRVILLLFPEWSTDQEILQADNRVARTCNTCSIYALYMVIGYDTKVPIYGAVLLVYKKCNRQGYFLGVDL